MSIRVTIIVTTLEELTKLHYEESPSKMSILIIIASVMSVMEYRDLTSRL